MAKSQLSKILTRGKAIFLAYDQGIEHGPTDFNDENVDPKYIIKIAKEGKYNGVIFHKGIAEKYKAEIKKSKVPLIIKLNGKTNLVDDEPISRKLCTVKEAKKLGATAVGFTIYIGSKYENIMLHEFEEVQKEAKELGMPVIAWIYPRGSGTKGKPFGQLLAYATRVGLEIGADIVKIHWDGRSIQELGWAVKSAGKVKVVIAGGSKLSERELLEHITEAKQAGTTGLAIGRNIWQSENPLELTEKIRKIIFARK